MVWPFTKATPPSSSPHPQLPVIAHQEWIKFLEHVDAATAPEVVGRSLDLWAYFSGVTLEFSRPGTPTDNPRIEAFNGRLRQECLDPNWFLCLDDARAKIEAWRSRYNREHPHSALGHLAPGEFAAIQAGKVGPMIAS